MRGFKTSLHRKRPTPKDYPDYKALCDSYKGRSIKVWKVGKKITGNQHNPHIVQKGDYVGEFKSPHHCACMLRLWTSGILKVLDSDGHTTGNYILEYS